MAKLEREINDLATLYPDLATQWHPTKNGKINPSDVTTGSGIKFWWIYHYDVPEDYHIEHLRGVHFDFEWQALIGVRIQSKGCPILTGHQVWAGFNDLATTHPEVADKWHPTKNIGLVNKFGKDISTPDKVVAHSAQKVWWILPYDVPEDCHIECLRGKHFDFEWESRVDHMADGGGCPFLSGQSVWEGFNDLKTTNPELAKEWHPTKNGTLSPSKVSAGCNKKVWWLLPYDIPMDYPIEHLRGKHFNFEWESSINHRAERDDKCPYLSGKAVWQGFNDLATTHPELIKEWDYSRNGSILPNIITAGCNKKVWWILPYDVPMDYPIEQLRGKHFNFTWESKINNRTILKRGCPYLAGQKIWPGFNDLATTHPKLVEQWHPTKNGKLLPSQVSAGSSRKKVWWQLQFLDKKTSKIINYEWKTSVAHRTIDKTDCPYIFSSKGENNIWKLLKSKNVKFEKQYVFEDRFLDAKNCKLRDDFAIFDNNDNIIGTIEYHGEQHYMPIDFAGKGKIWAENHLQLTQKRDAIKTKYLQERNIPQLVIPYWDFDKIETLVSDFIEELSKAHILY